jgi:para-nitrobenzyl esterase
VSPARAGSREAAPTALVPTTSGPVRGRVIGGLRRWLGVPYAVPPTGSLRWRPPRPAPTREDPLDAIAFGGICAQDTAMFPRFGYHSDNEDCLYLNVFSPADLAPGERLPVMVWIHGGGLFIGSADGYDPAPLVERGRTVVVTFNYRLGLFGFFSHPSINGEGHPAGNYALMDQQLALRWVRDNIDGFGGDPGNVTIFGESAGAISVVCHLASPSARGLFHRAIMQSAATMALAQIPSVEDVAPVGLALAAAVGCDDPTADSLRALSPASLLAANAEPPGQFGIGPFTLGPMVDGTLLPGTLADLFGAGQYNRVPVLSGINRDEFAWFLGMIELATGTAITPGSFEAGLRGTFAGAHQNNLVPFMPTEEQLGAIARLYDPDRHQGPARAVAAAVGDAGVIAGEWLATRLLRQHQAEVWAYEFDAPDAPVAWPSVSFPYGTAHVQEVQFLFPGFAGAAGPGPGLTGAHARLAEVMVDYWTAFARAGDPNPGAAGVATDAPHWPRYEADTDQFLLLAPSGPEVVSAFGTTHHIEHWLRMAAPSATES